jgi:hypothetical protein
MSHSVDTYFDDVLGEHEPIWRGDPEQMPIDSVCGEDCRKAIDAARDLIEHIRMAFGDDRPDDIDRVTEVARDVCCCYVNG